MWLQPDAIIYGPIHGVQVYHGQLRPEHALHDGSTNVAIKVRHPTVLDETYVDLKIIFGVVPILNVIFSKTTKRKIGTGDDAEERSGEIAVPFSTDSLFSTIQKQLDFKYEAFNIMEFHRNFYREIVDPEVPVRFPVVSTTLLSESILVETWEPGTTIADMFRVQWHRRHCLRLVLTQFPASRHPTRAAHTLILSVPHCYHCFIVFAGRLQSDVVPDSRGSGDQRRLGRQAGPPRQAHL